jgi:hypothetical protein
MSVLQTQQFPTDARSPFSLVENGRAYSEITPGRALPPNASAVNASC